MAWAAIVTSVSRVSYDLQVECGMQFHASWFNGKEAFGELERSLRINMKKSFFDFAGTLFKTSVYAVCGLVLMGMSSCSNDDEDDGGNRPTSGLVSTTIPSEGWSGSTTNGICTYRSDDMDEEYPSYYAFAFENGECTDAVFNIVCDSEATAQYISQMLNSGAWAEDGDDDDDEDYKVASLTAGQNPVLSQTLRYSKTIKTAVRNSRAANNVNNVMGITCTQEGRIVYFKVEAVKGLTGEDVKYVMKTWDTGLDLNNLPDKPVFGTWNDATGKYTSNSIYAIPGTKLEIETGFNSSDIVTKYVATFTLPNEIWAEMIEESLIEQSYGYKELFGIELEITRNGNVVTSKHVNVATANTAKSDLVKMIIALDILNARPIGVALF